MSSLAHAVRNRRSSAGKVHAGAGWSVTPGVGSQGFSPATRHWLAFLKQSKDEAARGDLKFSVRGKKMKTPC